jgi:small subunit ribosomal protein S14
VEVAEERTERIATMTTEAQNVKFRRQMKKLESSRQTPDKVKMAPRERIRIKRRCKLCGRARAVYRKFGICRICFRDLASAGRIPGIRKASW